MTWVFKWHKFLCVLLRILMNLVEDNRKRFSKDNYMLLIERDALEFQAIRHTFTQEEMDAMASANMAFVERG